MAGDLHRNSSHVITCCRRISFCYGHRVVGHEDKCATLHGHNAVVDVHAVALQERDALGRVIDFSVLKREVGGWIEEHWDHTMILWSEDRETVELLLRAPQRKPPYVLSVNPTAENLAEYLLREICPAVLCGRGVMVHRVVFWETANCSAEASASLDEPELRARYLKKSGC